MHSAIRSMHHPFALMLCTVGGAALLLLGFLLVGRAAGNVAREPDPAFLEARARWQANSFSSYRLVATFDTCFYDVVVRRDRITGGLRDSCINQARSISGLFEVIARDGEVTPNCGLRHCACEAVTQVQAEYDARLGYPTEITVFVETRPRWTSLDSWQMLIETRAPPLCSVKTIRSIRVLHVEPL
ncbi:MAG TPA: DUF6174 domain-containing protein [Roseiflexaceae bacterium]|nr:DUF6174 domain-containing protein [Roseiflexaceae bacterium]HMP41684.1 DUF6174 domain-containing protein [Roseiflexaceae bacterium]